MSNRVFGPSGEEFSMGRSTRNDFIFGHFYDTNKLCTIYKCDKTSFHENGATNNNGGIILPITNIQNKTVSIDVLVQGNRNVNPLALACPVDYPDDCAACSSGWHHGQSTHP